MTEDVMDRLDIPAFLRKQATGDGLKLLNAVSIIASLSIFVQLIWFLSYDF